MADNVTDQPEACPEDCSRFDLCSAPLCPLDKDINQRMWFVDEDVCVSHTHGKHRWIKKQRSIKRRQTKSYLNRPVTYKELYDNSRKKVLTPEQLEALRIRAAKLAQIRAGG